MVNQETCDFVVFRAPIGPNLTRTPPQLAIYCNFKTFHNFNNFITFIIFLCFKIITNYKLLGSVVQTSSNGPFIVCRQAASSSLTQDKEPWDQHPGPIRECCHIFGVWNKGERKALVENWPRNPLAVRQHVLTTSVRATVTVLLLWFR